MDLLLKELDSCESFLLGVVFLFELPLKINLCLVEVLLEVQQIVSDHKGVLLVLNAPMRLLSHVEHIHVKGLCLVVVSQDLLVLIVSLGIQIQMLSSQTIWVWEFDDEVAQIGIFYESFDLFVLP